MKPSVVAERQNCPIVAARSEYFGRLSAWSLGSKPQLLADGRGHGGCLDWGWQPPSEWCCDWFSERGRVFVEAWIREFWSLANYKYSFLGSGIVRTRPIRPAVRRLVSHAVNVIEQTSVEM